MKTNKKKIIWSSAIGIIVLIIGWIVWMNVNITTTQLTIKNQKIPSDFKGYKKVIK